MPLSPDFFPCIFPSVLKRLYRIKEEEGIIFVHGCGKKQSKLQKDIKELETYLAKYKEYNQKIHTCGERSSYSKTDNDATFMRMKEDHLGNPLLFPTEITNLLFVIKTRQPLK